MWGLAKLPGSTWLIKALADSTKHLGELMSASDPFPTLSAVPRAHKNGSVLFGRGLQPTGDQVAMR